MNIKAFFRPSLPTFFAVLPLSVLCSPSRVSFIFAAITAALLLCNASVTKAENLLYGTGATKLWSSTATWVEGTVPNAIGAAAIFTTPAANSGISNISVSLSSFPATVGSLTFDTLNTNTIGIPTGGPLTFNNGGAATITTGGAGSGNVTISVATVFTDTVTATVTNITASSAAGSLNLTAAISGSGGFTKAGDGLATFGTGAKTYTGPTVLNGGRMRMSLTAAATGTSSFTINASGQLTLITAGTYTFGSGPLNLNGVGAINLPYSAFPGAIRNDTSLAVTINNVVVLQSDTLLHVQGSATGSLTFSNNVSGPGKLTLTSQPHDANLGTLVLNGANSYVGGTVVDGGTLVVSGTSASLGTGNVTVNSSSVVFTGAAAKLTIQTGVTNAIADTATLTLAGGNAAGVADDGFAELQSGVNEVVAGLVLGGVAQVPGTYGSTTSGATVQNDEYFSGPGIVTVVAVAPLPSLKITLASPNAILSWPTNATGFTLQELAAFPATPPPYGWVNVNTNITPVVVSGTNNTVTVPASSGNDFFRLKN